MSKITPQFIDQILNQVPDYKEFLTIDELRQSAHALAEKYPETVTLIPIGHSKKNYPIEALKISDGPKNALVFAMPHPNEPIGSMMLEFLTTKLAEDAALRAELGYTWYIVKCVDPDGGKLNEGWMKGPFTITNYASNFYRPPSSLQVEWTFPVDYKTYSFNQPIPETQALMGLIEKVKPEFIYSLHNSGFGGAYLYLTRDQSSMYQPFYKLVESQDLPLHLGEAEVPYATKYSPAVFKMIGTEDMYDFMEAQMPGADPAAMLTSGGSSISYAARFNQVFGLVCEMPYFYNPAIKDNSSSGMTRREALLAMTAEARRIQEMLKQLYAKIQPELIEKSDFKSVFDENLTAMDHHYASQENWAKTDPETLRIATVAEKFDSLDVNRFYQLLSMGMFVRLVDELIQAKGELPVLMSARAEVKTAFDSLSAELEQALAYSVIPIQKLVRVQLGAGLIALQTLEE